MKLPSQDTARYTLSQKGDPYSSAEYRAILRSQSSGRTLTCTHCGFKATQEQIHEFHNTHDPSMGDGKINMDVLAEGWGLFRSLPLDFNPWHQEASNFELVCEPCFHAGHAFMPGFTPVGKYGLVNVMSQSEIIIAWRSLMLGSMSGKARAAQSRETLRTLFAQPELDLTRELSGPGSTTVKMTNIDLAYWVAYSKAEIYEVAPNIIMDLRFLPAIESSAYGIHLSFTHRYSPLYPPEAVTSASKADSSQPASGTSADAGLPA